MQNRYGSVFKVNSYWVVIGHFCHNFDRMFLFAFQDLPKGFSWNFSGSRVIYKHQLGVWKSQSLKWKIQVLRFCFSGSSALSIYVLNFSRLLGYRRNNWCVWKSNTIIPMWDKNITMHQACPDQVFKKAVKVWNIRKFK